MTALFDDNMILPLYKETLPPVNRIPKDDSRYAILQTIPPKEHDENDDIEYVYLTINDDKYYFITLQIYEVDPDIQYDNYFDYPEYKFDDDDNDDDDNDDADDQPQIVVEIEVQTFRYAGNLVIWLSGNKVIFRESSVFIK